MGATTQYTDFSDLYLGLQYRLRFVTGTSGTGSTTNQAQQAINTAVNNMRLGFKTKFPWWERRGVLLTHATYTTGTVTIADATRSTVTGSSTAWNTAVTGMGYNNTRAGGKLKFDDQNVYEVSSVGSDTSITLVDRYTGALGTGLAAGSSYTYFEDQYELASDFDSLVDLSSFDLQQEIRVLPRSEFYRKFPRNNQTGKPRWCTMIELPPSSSTARRLRVVFAPAPDAAAHIPYRYITTNNAVSSAGTQAANLSADADEPLIPLQYREGIILYALSQWYRDKGDDARADGTFAQYTDFMLRMSTDTNVGERRPAVRPNMSGYVGAARSPWRRTGRRRPYDLNGAFDQGL